MTKHCDLTMSTLAPRFVWTRHSRPNQASGEAGAEHVSSLPLPPALPNTVYFMQNLFKPREVLSYPTGEGNAIFTLLNAPVLNPAAEEPL